MSPDSVEVDGWQSGINCGHAVSLSCEFEAQIDFVKLNDIESWPIRWWLRKRECMWSLDSGGSSKRRLQCSFAQALVHRVLASSASKSSLPAGTRPPRCLRRSGCRDPPHKDIVRLLKHGSGDWTGWMERIERVACDGR